MYCGANSVQQFLEKGHVATYSDEHYKTKYLYGSIKTLGLMKTALITPLLIWDPGA